MPDIENSEKLKDIPLSLRQSRCIGLLLTCATHAEVKKQLKISDQTLYRWLKDPVFKKALSQQQNQIFQNGFDILRANITKATNVLISLLDAQGGELRRRTANDIINHVLRAKELNEIEERLMKVEKIISERQN